MIFLFTNGTYKVYDPLEEEEKVIKKFLKKRDKISAVMIEASTKLHSDTYTIIRAKNLKTKVEPFTMTYSLALLESNTPASPQNTFTRSVHISTVSEFYNLATLMYQIDYSSDCGDIYSLGDLRPLIITCSITYDRSREKIIWNKQEESLISFLERQEIFCDTDKFLDASMGTKDTMVDDGCYISRYDPSTGYENLQYYYHGKKSLIWMRDGRWELFSDNLVPSIESLAENPDPSVSGFYAICINKTGLVYLASYPFIFNYKEIQECNIVINNGVWNTIRDDRGNIMYHEPEILGAEKQYVAYNPVDSLYMALYLPQIWDIIRYMIGDTPVYVHFEVLQRKVYTKTGEYKVPELKDGQGLDIDLFAIMSRVFSFRPRSIAINE